VTDRSVLEELYAASNGEEWENNDHWMSAAPLSEWRGVAVDATGRVNFLNLSRNNLQGHFSIIIDSLVL